MESNEHEAAAHATVSGDVPRPRAVPVPGPGSRAGEGAGVAVQLLGITRALRAREREYLAGVLHDGPIQDLAAATLELSMARRAAGGELEVPERQVEAAGRSLRRLMEDLSSFGQAAQAAQGGRGGAGLAAALERRTAWLLSSSLAVNLGPGAAGLPDTEIEAVADLVELMLLGVVGAGAPARALAAVRAGRDAIAVELSMSVTADPGAARAWLNRLATAMQAGADIDLRGYRLRARMEIPRQAPG
jgi:Histidine kinase